MVPTEPFSASAGSSALAAALAWIETALLGPLATSLAIVAVGIFGVRLMAGQLNLRQGVQTIIGCFVLFGAPTIAQGILAASGANGADIDAQQTSPEPMLRPPNVAPTPAYDPYAAAAMPIG